ncbi:LacI family DNA-binding transcriptional regulator [bacterium]|nr:LacI family DNA-binding transcriptional regulator [bacterium]
MKNPTIKDVAQKAQVAISTVSLVINNKGNVSEKTRQKVQAAIHELNYQPSQAARRLAGKKTGNIGFIVSEEHFTRAEPFYTHIFLGSEFEAREHNVYILLTTVRNEFNPKKNTPRFLLDNSVDGVIVAGRIPEGLCTQLGHYNLPLVYVDFLPHNGQAQAILVDNFEGGRKAVNHLIECGCRDIVYVSGDITHPSMQNRFEGYQKALQENHLQISEKLISIAEPETTFLHGYNAMKSVLSRNQHFDGVFAANDAMALGCIRALKEANIQIPNDVAVIGFDDVAAASQSKPQLTTMRINKEEMGILALQVMMQMIKTGKNPKMKYLAPTHLLQRQST